MGTSAQSRKLDIRKLFEKLPPAGTTQWRAAASLLVLQAQADKVWPNRSTDSDGTVGDAAHQGRESDHNPWVKDGSMGVVTALDITHDPASGCDAQKIVDALVFSRDRRIKYLIWNRRIISASVQPWVWRSYSGSNPHDRHFHLSVGSNKALYDDKTTWILA